MTRPKPEHFPLTSAYYCENCGEVGNRAGLCACCGSASLISLAGILNRRIEQDQAKVMWEELEKGLVRK